MAEMISVEVAYALPERQSIVEVQVPLGSTAMDAVKQSKIEQQFAGLDVANTAMGVFGNELGTRGLAAPDAYLVRDGDRIELYRPLIADPKEVRKRRAAEAKEKRAAEKHSS